ncbi:hypothetical protein CZP2022_100 [Vibrio phage C-ZP2022]|nr:hypothetical protein CZP2022_100 [Vibrio phage C-ZP2022]
MIRYVRMLWRSAELINRATTDKATRKTNTFMWPAAESREEALEKDVTYYLTEKLCKHHPFVVIDDNTKLPLSLRYALGKQCVACCKERKMRSRMKKYRTENEDLTACTEARRKTEVLCEAKQLAEDLGITLSEAKEMLS